MTTTTAKAPLFARLLVGGVGVMTTMGALIADLLSAEGAAQHLHNDRWPPHAKFHDAQYVVMSILLGLIAFALVLGRRATKDRTLSAAAAVSTPWLGMLAAFLFPGTAAFDPEFASTAPMVNGVPGQVFLGATMVVLLTIAIAFTLRAHARDAVAPLPPPASWRSAIRRAASAGVASQSSSNRAAFGAVTACQSREAAQGAPEAIPDLGVRKVCPLR